MRPAGFDFLCFCEKPTRANFILLIYSQTGPENYPPNRIKRFQYLKRKLEIDEALLIMFYQANVSN